MIGMLKEHMELAVCSQDSIHPTVCHDVSMARPLLLYMRESTYLLYVGKLVYRIRKNCMLILCPTPGNITCSIIPEVL